MGESSKEIEKNGSREKILEKRIDLGDDIIKMESEGREKKLKVSILGSEVIEIIEDIELIKIEKWKKENIEDGLGMKVSKLKKKNKLMIRIVLIKDDEDKIIKIEIGDKEEEKDLEKILDIRKKELRKEKKKIIEMIKKLEKERKKRKEIRKIEVRKKVNVKWKEDLKIGKIEKRLNKKIGIESEVIRIKKNEDILRRLIKNIVKKRKIIWKKKLRDILDEERIMKMIGNLGEENKKGEEIEILIVKEGKKEKWEEKSEIGIKNIEMILEEDEKGREIREKKIEFKKWWRIGIGILLNIRKLLGRG